MPGELCMQCLGSDTLHVLWTNFDGDHESSVRHRNEAAREYVHAWFSIFHALIFFFFCSLDCTFLVDFLICSLVFSSLLSFSHFFSSHLISSLLLLSPFFPLSYLPQFLSWSRSFFNFSFVLPRRPKEPMSPTASIGHKTFHGSCKRRHCTNTFTQKPTNHDEMLVL